METAETADRTNATRRFPHRDGMILPDILCHWSIQWGRFFAVSGCNCTLLGDCTNCEVTIISESGPIRLWQTTGPDPALPLWCRRGTWSAAPRAPTPAEPRLPATLHL